MTDQKARTEKAPQEKLMVVGEPAEPREQELDLLELFFYLLERLKYIILVAVLGAIAMGAYSYFLATPQYESTAKLYVLSSKDSVVNLSDFQIGNYLASDYLEVFKTWEVNERVISNLSLPYTYSQMQGRMRVSNPSGTRILYITATAESPAEAALVANEYAAVAREYIAETMNTEAPNILSTALQPNRPVSPVLSRNILLGGVVGAVVAIAILVVMMMMDDKIKTTDDIERYGGLHTLAVIPMVGSGPKKGR